MRPTWDEYFLNIARAVSIRSHDEQTKVGCVIVGEDNRILSTGYNGFPRGFPDEQLPKNRPDKYNWIIHAEENAITSAYLRDLRAATLYCTHSPCLGCAKLILSSGIKKIICEELYENSDYDFILEFLRLGEVDFVVRRIK